MFCVHVSSENSFIMASCLLSLFTYRDFKVKEKVVSVKLTEEKLGKCARSLVFGKLRYWQDIQTPNDIIDEALSWWRIFFWSWSDGSVVKNPLLQWSQIQISVPIRQLTTVHVLGCQMPTSGLCENCTHMVHIILIGKISCTYIFIHRSLMYMADKLITVFKACHEGIK